MERLSLSCPRVKYLEFEEADHKSVADSGTEPPTAAAAEIQISRLAK